MTLKRRQITVVLGFFVPEIVVTRLGVEPRTY